MKYMVMECHLSYAVVLDESGHFLKVANRQYAVGQTVTDVVEMQIPQPAPKTKKANKWIYSLAGMAACLLVVAASVLQMGQMSYASVYMTINPEVRIDVNRRDMVVGLDGINDDGSDLIREYVYKKKDLGLVVDELVDRAIDMGYLHEGGQISLILDADSDEWIVAHSDTLPSHLNEHLNEKLTVTIEITDTKTQNNQVVIPIAPGESDYGESDYGKSDDDDDSLTDYDTDDGLTDYDTDDGLTDYDTDDGLTDYDTDDGLTDYDTDDGLTDYDTDDGLTDYDTDDGLTDYDTDDGLTDYDTDGGLTDYDTDGGLTDYDTDYD